MKFTESSKVKCDDAKSAFRSFPSSRPVRDDRFPPKLSNREKSFENFGGEKKYTRVLVRTLKGRTLMYGKFFSIFLKYRPVQRPEYEFW
jgi:hypothetical protein